MGDANGDGRADLFVVTQQRPGQPTCSTSFNYTHVNLHRVPSNSEGAFQLPTSWEDGQNSRELDISWDDVAHFPGLPKAGDFNGDGADDFIIAQGFAGGDPFDPSDDYVKLYEDLSPHPTGDAYNWLPAEVNGDGRSDFVYIRYTETGPLLFTMVASGSSYLPIAQSPTPGTNEFSAIKNYKIMDVNGDRRDDLAYLHFRSPTQGVEIYTWLSEGNGNWQGISAKVLSFRVSERNRDTLNWMPLDVNADGKMDLVYLDVSRYQLYTLESNGVAVPLCERSVSPEEFSGLFLPCLVRPVLKLPSGLQDPRSAAKC